MNTESAELLERLWVERAVKYETKKEVTITLESKELLYILGWWCREHPEVAAAVLTVEGKINCPYPFMCKHFPCKSLSCKADSLINGYPVRD